MSNPVDRDFVAYCEGLSDRQLENVLQAEWQAHGHRDYPSAELAAAKRGWTCKKGERVS